MHKLTPEEIDQVHDRLLATHRLLRVAVRFVCQHAYLLDDTQWNALGEALMHSKNISPELPPELGCKEPWWVNDS